MHILVKKTKGEIVEGSGYKNNRKEIDLWI